MGTPVGVGGWDVGALQLRSTGLRERSAHFHLQLAEKGIADKKPGQLTRKGIPGGRNP